MNQGQTYHTIPSVQDEALATGLKELVHRLQMIAANHLLMSCVTRFRHTAEALICDLLSRSKAVLGILNALAQCLTVESRVAGDVPREPVLVPWRNNPRRAITARDRFLLLRLLTGVIRILRRLGRLGRWRECWINRRKDDWGERFTNAVGDAADDDALVKRKENARSSRHISRNPDWSWIGRP